MATEPTKLPEWASADPVDPVSGMNAIAEPSEAKKDSGFLRSERPPRQDFNWLFNLLYLWIDWFKQQVDYLFNNVSEVITNNDITVDTGESGQLESALEKNFFPIYHHSGFSSWRSAGLPTPQISIAGGCTADRYSATMINTRNDSSWPSSGAGVMRKTVQAAWARGDNVGGMTSGVSLPLATGWYYIFAVCLNARNEVDIVFDNDMDGSNVIADMSPSAIRRIGCFYWIGSLAIFQMAGKYFSMENFQRKDHVSPAIVSSAAILLEVQCPPLDSIIGQFTVIAEWAAPITGNNHLVGIGGGIEVGNLIEGQGKAVIGESFAYCSCNVRPDIDSSVPKIAVSISRENSASAPTAPSKISIFTKGFIDPLEYEFFNPW